MVRRPGQGCSMASKRRRDAIHSGVAVAMEPVYEAAADLAERLTKWLRSRAQSPVQKGQALGSWREQWDRVLLALDRVEAVYAGRPEPEGTAGAYYDTYGFFLQCHHLKDWIRSD